MKTLLFILAGIGVASLSSCCVFIKVDGPQNGEAAEVEQTSLK